MKNSVPQAQPIRVIINGIVRSFSSRKEYEEFLREYHENH